ncbi:tRNA uridine-5-carboxymethylaminomethyl(34) synthesis GTPase MnmE [Longibacter salinarum]|uniref:tRNA modification GTPase MnmE n=1 Tax=Longibacter salinarum TaxID=1850348 RepID=A0A2A8CV50_9BACT|nr:tRNA uridine-5-carboxymethylaminomethyl(34) synthesis GTPase MnmE [Longibacter salinarum]PEN12340.1 tRNA uridine-5-carboxymethylaminomethyl(34) synthesis GTPase MnmE [Longibacter salinarum]
MTTATTDTIAAQATARGRAALAIIRTSGPDAISVVDQCFRGADLAEAESHTAHVGYIVDADGEDVDQVVVTIFRAPRSATGENVAEVSCHGGDLAPKLVLQTLLAHGARMAEPGEFTQRGFLNGKLDLAQAEAVADLIHASSTRAHQVSLQHLQGRYSEQLNELREELLDLCGLMELEIDFTEEDVEFADRERLEELLGRAASLLDTLLATADTGETLKDGVRVVIGGRPNAGKSTLLNALVGRDRAIVSATPGTTRDEIEAEVEIDGVLFRFVDTAGLRDTTDQIEAEGVRRAERSIEQADVLIYVYDLQEGLDAEEQAFLRDVADESHAVETIVVGNKVDLVETPSGDGQPARAAEVVDDVLYLSADAARRDVDALEPLRDRLAETVADQLSRADASLIVTNQRHRSHLQSAREAIQNARNALDAGVSGDLLTLDLRQALHELGSILGTITNEDVLGQIFSRFCIGK